MCAYACQWGGCGSEVGTPWEDPGCGRNTLQCTATCPSVEHTAALSPDARLAQALLRADPSLASPPAPLQCRSGLPGHPGPGLGKGAGEPREPNCGTFLLVLPERAASGDGLCFLEHGLPRLPWPPCYSLGGGARTGPGLRRKAEASGPGPCCPNTPSLKPGPGSPSKGGLVLEEAPKAWLSWGHPRLGSRP